MQGLRDSTETDINDSTLSKDELRANTLLFILKVSNQHLKLSPQDWMDVGNAIRDKDKDAFNALKTKHSLRGLVQVDTAKKTDVESYQQQRKQIRDQYQLLISTALDSEREAIREDYQKHVKNLQTYYKGTILYYGKREDNNPYMFFNRDDRADDSSGKDLKHFNERDYLSYDFGLMDSYFSEETNIGCSSLDAKIQNLAQQVLTEQLAKLVYFDLTYRGNVCGLGPLSGDSVNIYDVRQGLELKDSAFSNRTKALSEEMYFMYILNAIIAAMRNNHVTTSSYKQDLKLSTGFFQNFNYSDFDAYVNACVPDDADGEHRVYAAMRYMMQFLLVSNVNLKTELNELDTLEVSPAIAKAVRTLDANNQSLGLGLFSASQATRVIQSENSNADAEQQPLDPMSIIFDNNTKLVRVVAVKKPDNAFTNFFKELLLAFREVLERKSKAKDRNSASVSRRASCELPSGTIDSVVNNARSQGKVDVKALNHFAMLGENSIATRRLKRATRPCQPMQPFVGTRRRSVIGYARSA